MKTTPVKILLGFVSFLLGICLFVTMLASILILDVRAVAEKESLQNIISVVLFAPSADLPGFHGNVTNTRALLAADGAVPSDAGEDSAARWLYDVIVKYFGGEAPITYAQFNTLFEASSIKAFVSEKIASVINDVYTGKSTTVITQEEIQHLLVENKALIEANFSCTISEAQITEIVTAVEKSGVTDFVKIENIEKIIDVKISAEKTQEPQTIVAAFNQLTQTDEPDLASVLVFVRYVTSAKMVAQTLGTCLALVCLLVLIYLKTPHTGLINSGIPILLAGILMLLPAALSGLLSSMLGGTIGSLLKQILLPTGIVSGITAGVGLLLIVSGVVLGKVTRKSCQTKEAAS